MLLWLVPCVLSTIRFLDSHFSLQLYKEAEVKDVAFTGVPVFQAEGLTVKTEKTRYTPLFFSKEDLDAAVGNAYEQREQHRDNVNKSNSARADADLEAAQSKVFI